MIKEKNHYIDNEELERCWIRWNESYDEDAWDKLTKDIYKICQGVAVKFNPRDAEEHSEYAHETFVLTLEKIRDGRLKFIPGKAPAFNLLTTTIIRHLYSKMKKRSRETDIIAQFRRRKLDEYKV